MDVLDEADDFHPCRVGPFCATDLHAFADRIFLCEVLPGERLIDHDYPRRLGAVILGESATAQNGDIESLEVSGSDKEQRGYRGVRTGRQWLGLNCKAVARVDLKGRKAIG